MKYTKDVKSGLCELEYTKEEEDQIMADISTPFYRDQVLIFALERSGLMQNTDAIPLVGGIIDRLIELRDLKIRGTHGT